MNATIIAALVRHILTPAGAGVVAKYGIDTGSFESIVGGVATAVGVVWSIWDKRKLAAA